MTEPNINETIKQLVLAHDDGDIEAIAAIVINKEGEPELHLAMPHQHGYKIIAGIQILNFNIIKKILDDAARPLEDRE